MEQDPRPSTLSHPRALETTFGDVSERSSLPMPRPVARGDVKIYEAMIGRQPRLAGEGERCDAPPLPRASRPGDLAEDIRAEVRTFLTDARRTLDAASLRLRRLRERWHDKAA